MEINEALIIIFLMGLSVPLFSYHIFLLAKTARKINYYFAVFSILYSIYIVLFSAIPQNSLIGTSLFQLIPIIKLFVILGIIYSYHGIIRYGFKIKFPLVTSIYYGIITLGALGWLLFVISRWNYPMPISNLAMEICIQILLLSFYVVLLYSMFNNKVEGKKVIYIILTCVLAFFLMLSILSYVFPYLEMFRYFLIYIPIVLYVYSFYIFNSFVKYESIQEEEYEEERQETVEKLLVAQEKSDDGNKSKLLNNLDVDEETKINIPFTEELRKKIEYYNSINKAVPMTGLLQEEIFLHAKRSVFEDFINSLFTFIYNTKNSSQQFNLKIECGRENIFLSCGDFSLSVGNKSLNMEKMRLIQLKKSVEELGGNLSLIKNQETGGMIIRLKFPCLSKDDGEDTKVIPFKEGVPTVLLVTDSPDSLCFFSNIFYDKYNLVSVSTVEDVLEKLSETEYLCLICAMSNDGETQEIYYAIDNLPAFSSVPILLLVNEHQSYLELKNYRQFKTVEWVNPVESDTVIAGLEDLQIKIEQNRTRNIEAIDSKIDSAPSQDNGQDVKKNAMTQKEFDEKALLYGLTNNEKVVTVLLLNGLEYREIAAKTKVSVDRILTLTNSIYRKTGTASKIELIDLFLKGN